MWPPHPHLGGPCPRPPAWCQPWTKVHSAKVCRPPAAGSVTGRAGYSHAFWVLSELPSQISIISVVQPPIKSRPAEQALAVGPVPSVPLLCPGRASDTATPHATGSTPPPHKIRTQVGICHFHEQDGRHVESTMPPLPRCHPPPPPHISTELPIPSPCCLSPPPATTSWNVGLITPTGRQRHCEAGPKLRPGSKLTPAGAEVPGLVPRASPACPRNVGMPPRPDLLLPGRGGRQDCP